MKTSYLVLILIASLIVLAGMMDAINQVSPCCGPWR